MGNRRKVGNPKRSARSQNDIIIFGVRRATRRLPAPGAEGLHAWEPLPTAGNMLRAGVTLSILWTHAVLEVENVPGCNPRHHNSPVQEILAGYGHRSSLQFLLYYVIIIILFISCRSSYPTPGPLMSTP